MNYKFRKRLVVIEAFQMTKEHRASNVDWPEWLHEAWNPDDESLFIHTLEGDVRVTENDWIIRGVQGELYSCKPDIFAATYDSEEEDEQENE